MGIDIVHTIMVGVVRHLTGPRDQLIDEFRNGDQAVAVTVRKPCESGRVGNAVPLQDVLGTTQPRGRQPGESHAFLNGMDDGDPVLADETAKRKRLPKIGRQRRQKATIPAGQGKRGKPDRRNAVPRQTFRPGARMVGHGDHRQEIAALGPRKQRQTGHVTAAHVAVFEGKADSEHRHDETFVAAIGRSSISATLS